MSMRSVVLWAAMICLFAATGYSRGNDELKKYFNDAASRVKATSDPQEKRDILQTAFSRMNRALDEVSRSPMVPESDRKAVRLYQSSIQEKQNELNGTGGYSRVTDDRLNAFSEYAVQDLEQADQVLTISLTTLLLVIILIVLLAK